MNRRTLPGSVPSVARLAGAALLLLAPSVPAQEVARATPAVASAPRARLENAPIESYRRELLDFAFRTASVIPSFPHIKSRSRLQEQVVVECFELDQPALALGYLKRIDNWRRAASYADLAFYLAQKGQTEGVEGYLELARTQVDEMIQKEEAGEEDDQAIEGFQAWRRDRIRAKIARTFLVLGKAGRAIEFEEGLEPSEEGIVSVVRARSLPASEAVEQAGVLDLVGSQANLEAVRNELNVGIELLKRFWDDETKRKLFLQKLEGCIDNTPALFRFDYMTSLAEVVIEHGDDERALKLLARAEQGLSVNPLTAEDDVPLRARLAELRFRAGLEEQGREELEAALAAFHEAGDEIVNLRRSDALLPIAEAFVTLGDRARALEVYKLAAVEGARNENSMPRAEDLVALCCSLAENGVLPDAELWKRLQETVDGVNGPW